MNRAIHVEPLGELGGNASVFKVELPSTTVILKTTVARSKDNLSYEHQAGLWINSLDNNIFARTFGFYSAPPGEVDLKFVRRLRAVHTSPSKQCEPNENKFLAVEYFKGSGADDLIQRDPEFILHLPRALYRIYSELSKVKRKFTHYDLHLGNVLFDIDYNPKIIDFGRCHFPEVHEVERRVCSVCQVCGVSEGYWFQPDGSSASIPEDFYVNPASSNQSHDLLYLFKLNEKYGSLIRKVYPELSRLLNTVVYEGPSGTPELKSNGRNICNVTDAANAFKRMARRKGRVRFSFPPRVFPIPASLKVRRTIQSSAGRTPARRASTRRR